MSDRARKDIQDCEGLYCRFVANEESTILELAGQRANRIMSEPDFALSCILDNDTEIRLAALLWLTADPVRDCRIDLNNLERLAFQDDSDEVRGLAMLSLIERDVDGMSELGRSTVIELRKGKARPKQSTDLEGDSLAAGIESTLTDIAQTKTEISDWKYERWKEIIGAELDTLLQSREEVEKRLWSSQADHRIGAIVLLAEYWKPTKVFLEQCKTMWHGDSDDRVRVTALQALASCFRDSKDRDIGQLLDKVASDQSCPSAARTTAEFALGRIEYPALDRE